MDKNLDSLPSKELLHSESLNTSGGDLELVQLQHASGANIDSQDDRKLSFLMAAFREGYVDVFKLLVSRVTQFPSDQEMARFMTTVTDKEMIKKCSQFVDTIRIAKERQAAEANKNANILLEELDMERSQEENQKVAAARKRERKRRKKREKQEQTGLTSLMGADVDVPPVPASHTALTVIDEKGQLIQLIYDKDAIVNVKNEKGQSLLWLYARAGDLELVQLLHANGANIDSQDNRKVSCLMAAFRAGHVEVVEWMVKHVKQFPSDQEMDHFKTMVTDKEMTEKCGQCEHIIRIAREGQAAEAEKIATNLLAEIDMKKCQEENRKVAAARKRESKRKKKREKQEQLRAVKAAAEESEKSEKSDDHPPSSKLHLSDPSDDEDEKEEEVEKNDSEILPSEIGCELLSVM